VIDPQSQALLQDIVGRESRSVLRYVHDAYPWATAAEEGLLATLRGIIAQEARAVAVLGQYLIRRHLPPPLPGSYPSSFTTINFLALDYLLPRLVDAEAQSLAELERDLRAVADQGAHAEVEKLVQVKRRNAQKLEELASAHAPGAARTAVAQPQPAGA
jgi:hypothetical protein